MSEASEKLKRDRHKLITAFVDAAKKNISKDDQVAAIVYALLCTSIVATTLPAEVATKFFSILAGLCLVAFIAVCKKSKIMPDRRSIVGLVLLCSMSIITGCGPVLWADPPPKLDFGACGPTECKKGQIKGVGVFGFGLSDLNIDAAKKAGNLKMARGYQDLRGYGLISMARVTVVGE